MTRASRMIQHWGQWFEQPLGKNILHVENQLFKKILSTFYGKHSLLIGVSQQSILLENSIATYHSLLSILPGKHHSYYYIEGDYYELPFLTGSIDLVLLPHTLECVDNPQNLITEACRVVKPGGGIIISGFNPYSFWGLRKFLSTKKAHVYPNHFVHACSVKKWLQLSDFETTKQMQYFFWGNGCSDQNAKHVVAENWISKMGGSLFGSLYTILAEAKRIPLTPVRLRWKQQLSGIRISTTMTGHIARKFL